MNCIFCDKESEAKSIEHIVPESFGNTTYTLQKGKVCDNCNNKFSSFEGKALTNSVFVMERSRFGVATKRGKNVKGKLNELIIEADKKFRKDILTISGLNEENTQNFNPRTKTFDLIVPTFDKSEVATSKLLLKMGYESIYKSQKNVFEKYNFQELKDYLTAKENKDWPFLNSSIEIEKFISIPRYFNKYKLKKLHCELYLLELNENSLIFKFIYGSIIMIINLLNRNLDWIRVNVPDNEIQYLYPEHYKNKLKKNRNANNTYRQ